ncbi:hypothetical protein NQZ68_012068 [Dissostichus eleginoides]|nr:hypothetical protein NQZ68_012068 [Dissostichus eleginoides]
MEIRLGLETRRQERSEASRGSSGQSSQHVTDSSCRKLGEKSHKTCRHTDEHAHMPYTGRV